MESLLIGITGAMGSGKSTVADFFQEWGCAVIHSDDVARSIMETDSALQDLIHNKFGVTMFPGSVTERSKLADIVFRDQVKLQMLNAMVHPPIIDAIFSLVSNYHDDGFRIVAVESALIYSAGIQSRFDFIVSILTPTPSIIERVQKQRNLSPVSINQRLQNQKLDEVRYAQADFVIRNTGSLEDLKNRTEFVFRLINAYLR